jgi:pantoate--beta-alanine ligase
MSQPLLTVSMVREVRGQVAAARRRGESIALVPTMGALHEGHASLIRRAAADSPLVVVSIFVNPAQFGPAEDYRSYPRTLAEDQRICQENGAKLVYAPSVEEMYGRHAFAAGEAPRSCYVETPGLADVLEGDARPGHFRGVATVVLKLFNQVQPDTAYFGQKDAQQLAVIRRMVQDLDVPVEIVACPTVRAEDGLALSSRNSYLTPQQRQNSTALFRALKRAKELFDAGERDGQFLGLAMGEVLDETPGCQRDYALVVDPYTFQKLERIGGPALALVAAKFGKTRLIDNMMLTSETALT